MRKEISKRIRFTICCILYISSSLVVMAQQPETNFNLTSFTPRSPNVAAMERFGTYPINHYTGTVPLSVDLYSLPLSKEFTLNVQLQYHSGGIKVSDINSWTGTSWSLQAGGCISREVRGMPDDYDWGFYRNKEIVRPHEMQDLTWKALNQIHPDDGLLKDLEPDIFYFNVNGRSIKFFLDADKNFRTIPHADIKIVRHPLEVYSDPSASIVDGTWEIIDESGTKYIFMAKEGRGDAIGIRRATTAWMLWQVISPEGKILASFGYKHSSGRVVNTEPVKEKMTILTGWENSVEEYRPRHIELGLVQIRPDYGFNRLITNQLPVSVTLHDGSSLTFKEGAIVKDGTGLSVLESVSLNIDKDEVSSYNFEYIGEKGRDYLKKISKTADGQSMVLRHFEYNDYMPARNSRSVDYWGYFNGIGNSSLIPYNKKFQKKHPYLYGNRNATSSASKGLIKKVHYPTGGYTEFEFETNISHGNLTETYKDTCVSYKTLSSPDILDIEKLNDGESITVTKRLQNTDTLWAEIILSVKVYYDMSVYFGVELRSVKTGSVVFSLRPQTIHEEVTMENGRYRQYIESKDSEGAICRIKERVTLYEEEYIMSLTATRNTSGDLPYAYSSFYCESASICTGTRPADMAGFDRYAGGTRVSSVKNYDSDDKLLTHTAYSYSSTAGIDIDLQRDYGYRQASGGQSHAITASYMYSELNSSDMSNYSGPNVRYPSVTERKIDFNTKDTLITKYSYTNFTNERFPSNSTSGRNIPMLPYSLNDYKGGLLKFKEDYILHNKKQIPIRFEGNTYSTVGKPSIFESIMLYKFYEGPTSLTTGPNMEGDLNQHKFDEYKWGHYEVTSEKQVLSKQSVTDYIYDSGYDKPAKKIVTTTNYQYKDNDYMQPEYITTVDSKGQTIKNTIQYCYDISSTVHTEMKNRNIISQPVRKKTYVGGKETESVEYTWGFFNSNKIVELKTAMQKASDGSTQNEITYHNYDEYGNPIYLSSKGDNMVYLWSYNGRYPVAVISNSTYAKVNQSVADIGLASVNQLSRSSTPNKVLLDKLRALLPDAQVSTFRYDPLKGLMEQTSPSGATTYYSYDSFNRLKEVYTLRNNKKEIVESYDYNYSKK